MDWILLLLVGFLSGITISLGLGGGFVLLLYLSFFTNIPQREAQLLNLLFFLPIAAYACRLHRKEGLIEGGVTKKALLFGFPGALLGVWLGGFLPTDLLMKCFGGLVLLVGLRETFGGIRRKNAKK